MVVLLVFTFGAIRLISYCRIDPFLDTLRVSASFGRFSSTFSTDIILQSKWILRAFCCLSACFSSRTKRHAITVIQSIYRKITMMSSVILDFKLWRLEREERAIPCIKLCCWKVSGTSGVQFIPPLISNYRFIHPDLCTKHQLRKIWYLFPVM